MTCGEKLPNWAEADEEQLALGGSASQQLVLVASREPELGGQGQPRVVVAGEPVLGPHQDVTDAGCRAAGQESLRVAAIGKTVKGGFAESLARQACDIGVEDRVELDAYEGQGER